MPEGLISIRNPKPKKEAKRDMHECVPSPYYEKYPYNTRIELNGDLIKKLGINIKECRVGDVGAVHAQVKIKRVENIDSLNERTGKMEERREVCLHITDMAFQKGVTKAEHESSKGLTKRAARGNPTNEY